MIYKIAVLAGDGIGPEIMKEGLKVLHAIGKKYAFDFVLQEALIGGCAYDQFAVPLPEATQKLCRAADAVLLGSIGGPQWDNLAPELKPELGGLLALRKLLKLYANLRPIFLFAELQDISPLSFKTVTNKIDLVTVRELSSGIYFGQPKELSADFALDTMSYRRDEIIKICHVAFQLAGKRQKHVTSVDKANVLCSSMLWRKVVNELAADYPDIKLNHMYVDNAAMQLVLNPGQFDVILTENLFGDILSDESAAICGSLGMLPSASLGESLHLFEPAGGSAPDIAGKGIANPIAQILSVALMLEHSFALTAAAGDIVNAVQAALKNGYRTPDIARGQGRIVSTAAMGDAIVTML
jgi:3-isopropylmalate dehydrogenase